MSDSTPYGHILAGIIIFWFILSFLLSIFGTDAAVAQSFEYSSQNYSLYNSSAYINMTDTLNPTISATGVLKTFIGMFGFSLPQIFPTLISIIVTFLNWFLAILLLLCLYGIAKG